MRRPERKAMLLELGPIDYLNHWLARQGDEQYVGFKLLYYQLEEHYRQKWDLPDLSSVRDYLRDDKSLKIIHLKRMNILRSYVSARVALENRSYVIYDAARRDNTTRITIDPAHCEQNLERTAHFHQFYDRFFANHDLLDVRYEDLAANTDAECQRILKFLGVRPRRLQASTVKQNVRPLSDIVSNYDELREHFAGTRWESMFEE